MNIFGDEGVEWAKYRCAGVQGGPPGGAAAGGAAAGGAAAGGAAAGGAGARPSPSRAMSVQSTPLAGARPLIKSLPPLIRVPPQLL
jgi:hypothetical protein